MQRILKITITSHENYSDAEFFSYDVASVLRKFIRPVNEKHAVGIDEAKGKLVTRNGTTLTFSHFYKEES